MRGALLVAVLARAVSAAEPDGGVAALEPAQLDAVLALECQSCHSLGYVEQQRLSAAQWTATLTKMRTWGALLAEDQVEPLARALALRRGPTATLEAPPRTEVRAFEAREPPGRSAKALAQGRALFAARCAACHAPDGRGLVGVNLTDRALLQEPAAFAEVVARGRGRMPPQPDLSAGQLSALRAFLGAQR